MKMIVDLNEWDEEETKPTVVEKLLSAVRDNRVLVKFIPQLSQNAVEIVVSRYNVDDLSDKIGTNIGFFLTGNEDVIALSSASIKRFKIL